VHEQTPTTALNDDELLQLRSRVAELERSEAKLRDQLAFARALADRATHVLYVYDVSKQLVVYVNQQISELVGYSLEEILRMGSSLFGTLIHPEDLPSVLEHNARLLKSSDGDVLEITYRMRRKDGDVRWLASRETPFARGPDGAVTQYLGSARDVTVELRAEEERAKLSAKIIEAQRDALRELGTPLIPITDDAIAMPVIGVIDDARASQLMETLLRGIVERRARVAILDITGVKMVNAAVADAILRAARATRLLGAEVVLTGVQPEMARTLIELGVELTGVAVRSTFQSGIEYALRGRRPARG
jgi:rsbT co-antagonist protein RsbR